MSTHAPPQEVLPTLQHLLLVQWDPVGQALAHLPQWALALVTSVHFPPQQANPLGQALPHAPQWALEVFRSTQDPLHVVVPDGQPDTQLLLAHTLPAAHLVPHLPQLPALLVKSTHLPPQLV